MRTIILFLLLTFPSVLFAQFGNLDNTFDGDGQFILSETGTFTSIAVQPDGKIVAVGNISNLNTDITVVRLNPDGSLDPNFGGIGGENFDFGNQDLAIRVLLQPDGKILIGGYSNSPTSGGNYQMFVMRLYPDASEDLSFGTNGRVDVGFGISDPNGVLYDMELLPNGKILIAGSTNSASETDIALARLNSDGTLDTDFSFDGMLTYDIQDMDLAYAMHVQANGRITLAGSTTVGGGGQPRGLLVQLHEDGSFVNTFGSVGVSLIDLPNPNEQFNDIQMDGAGRFYLAGRHQASGGDTDGVIARITSNGALDPSFSFDGVVYTDHTGDHDFGERLLIQPDGRILVAVRASTLVGYVGVLYRLHEDGIYDDTFGANGKVVLDDVPGTFFYSLALQPDLKILAGGRAGPTQMLIARYTSGMNVGIAEVDAYIGSTLIYPNPVTNNQVTIEYELKSDERVSIELFDLTGKMIAQLQSWTAESAGSYQKMLALPELSAGNYLMKLNTEKGSVSVKMMVD